MRPTWDQPDADPMADIKDMLKTMRERGHEKPSFLYIGPRVAELIDIEEAEKSMTETMGWPVKIVVQ